MVDDLWPAGMNMDAKLVERFTRLAGDMGISAATLISMMMAKVLDTDANLRRSGLNGLSAFKEKDYGARVAATIGANNLPTDVRPSDFMWPADRPFLWTAEDCKAAVLGYQVRWPGNLFDVDDRLRGHWEIDDDEYLVLSHTIKEKL